MPPASSVMQKEGRKEGRYAEKNLATPSHHHHPHLLRGSLKRKEEGRKGVCLCHAFRDSQSTPLWSETDAALENQAKKSKSLLLTASSLSGVCRCSVGETGAAAQPSSPSTRARLDISDEISTKSKTKGSPRQKPLALASPIARIITTNVAVYNL